MDLESIKAKFDKFTSAVWPTKPKPADLEREFLEFKCEQAREQVAAARTAEEIIAASFAQVTAETALHACLARPVV